MGFAEGMRVGQAAINTAVQSRMQREREDRLRNEFVMERKMKEALLEIDQNAMQAFSGFAQESLNSGVPISDRASEIFANPAISRSPNVLSQALKAIDADTRRRDASQDKNILAKSARYREMGFVPGKGNGWRWFNQPSSEEKLDNYLRFNNDANLMADGGELDHNKVEDWWNNGGREMAGAGKAGSVVPATDSKGNRIPGVHMVMDGKGNAHQVRDEGMSDSLRKEIAAAKGKLERLNGHLEGETDPSFRNYLKAEIRAVEAEVRVLLVDEGKKQSGSGGEEPPAEEGTGAFKLISVE